MPLTNAVDEILLVEHRTNSSKQQPKQWGMYQKIIEIYGNLQLSYRSSHVPKLDGQASRMFRMTPS